MRLRRGEGRLLLLLLVAYGWLFVFFPGINNPNELVRIYTARALVEEHTWSIGRRDLRAGRVVDSGPVYSDWGYVNDKALTCDDARARPPQCAGRLFAAKAPGASVLAVPVLALLRAFGPVHKAEAVLALRWVWVILPSILFWLALRRWMLEAGVPEPAALACTLSGALGSLSLTYGQMFAGHQLAALALGAAFLCAFGTRWRPAWFGFFGALSVALEFPSAPAAAILLLAALLQHRRGFLRVALGGLPWVLLLAQFHWSAFGSPWATPYGHLENPGFVRDMGPNAGISMPTPERLYGSLVAPYLGLFFWAPWTALSLLAPWWMRRSLPGRAAFLIIFYYVAFQLGQSLWRSGWVVGPRYITPLVPFAAVCIGLAARTAPRWWFSALGGLGAAGIAATGLASSVCQGFPLEVENPLREVVWPLLSHGYAAPNLLQAMGVPGLWSAVPYFAALATGIALLVRRNAAALAIGLAVSMAQWAAPARNDRGAARFLASQWDPAPPPGASPF